jgi:hypothetical protein
MKHITDTGLVPLWLWRLVVGTLALVIVIGVTAGLWLGTRPAVTGAPISAQDLGAWSFGPGASGVEADAQLTLRAGDREGVVYATRELSLSDFVVQVRARLSRGPDDAGYGLMVRESPNDFVALLIGPDGYIAIGQKSGGVWRWRVPWQPWPHIKRGAGENLLRAECRAERCRFYVNDEFAFEVDGVSRQGRQGPAVWNPAQGESVSAVFEEWRVWK